MVPTIGDRKLRKKEILSSRKELHTVFKTAKSVSSQALSVLYTDAPSRKVAFFVSKDVAPKAVMRNRIKRYLREIYRNHKECFPDDYWYIIQARTSVVNKSFQELQSELLDLVKKIDDKKYLRKQHSVFQNEGN